MRFAKWRRSPPPTNSSTIDDNRLGNPTYDADYLRVWNKNTDFMREQKFVEAYQAGMKSDHRLDRHAPDTVDIHIEWRIHVCCWAAWHAKQLAGDFVECGTNTGIMSLAICHYIDFNSTGKRFFLFDTYRGIPEEQIGPEEGHAREQNLAYRDCFETTKRNFSPFPRAILVRGKVPETLQSRMIEKICYLMLDMNIAAPERAALSYLWDKIVPGGIVLFDDYGWLGYDAQKTAHDDFAAKQRVKILNLPTGQGMLIKP
jgi:O-methyltransferase